MVANMFSARASKVSRAVVHPPGQRVWARVTPVRAVKSSIRAEPEFATAAAALDSSTTDARIIQPGTGVFKFAIVGVELRGRSTRRLRFQTQVPEPVQTEPKVFQSHTMKFLPPSPPLRLCRGLWMQLQWRGNRLQLLPKRYSRASLPPLKPQQRLAVSRRMVIRFQAKVRQPPRRSTLTWTTSRTR
jgi:hypothetical protein